DEEAQIGKGAARLCNHALAEINADAERGLERRQEIAGAAAELEHARAFRDQKFQVAHVLGVEERGALEPSPALRRAGVGEAAHVLLACGQLGALHGHVGALVLRGPMTQAIGSADSTISTGSIGRRYLALAAGPLSSRK